MQKLLPKYMDHISAPSLFVFLNDDIIQGESRALKNIAISNLSTVEETAMTEKGGPKKVDKKRWTKKLIGWTNFCSSNCAGLSKQAYPQ